MSRVPPATTVTGTVATAGTMVQIVGTVEGSADTLDATDAYAQGFEGYATNPPMDVVTIWAENVGAATRTLSILWGGTGVANRIVKDLAVGGGPTLVVDRWLLQKGSTLKAFATVTLEVNVKVQRWPYTGGAI